MEDAEKLVELLKTFFSKRGIEADIKEFNFDFEFTFDIRGIELTILNRILSSLTDLNRTVLVEYNTELEMYDTELTVFFDRLDSDDSIDDIDDNDIEDA